MRKKIVAGNWKMNTSVAEGVVLAKAVAAAAGQVSDDVQLVVAPPFTHLVPVGEALRGSKVALGAQNCADQLSGAYTGEVAAPMLSGIGCTYVILGHSERRQYYGETSSLLARQLELALQSGLTPIFCVGENLAEREAGRHFDVVEAQLSEALFHLDPGQVAGCVIAYEPVWAIGTGVTATAAQAQEIHAFIRNRVAGRFGEERAEGMTLLYGGSCKPGNAGELFACPDIDGGLIGGAALKADDFMGIVSQAENRPE